MSNYPFKRHKLTHTLKVFVEVLTPFEHHCVQCRECVHHPSHISPADWTVLWWLCVAECWVRALKLASCSWLPCLSLPLFFWWLWLSEIWVGRQRSNRGETRVRAHRKLRQFNRKFRVSSLECLCQYREDREEAQPPPPVVWVSLFRLCVCLM